MIMIISTAATNNTTCALLTSRITYMKKRLFFRKCFSTIHHQQQQPAKNSNWRFTEPLHRTYQDPCRVLFAGPHFHAGFPFTQQVLKQRGYINSDHNNNDNSIIKKSTTTTATTTSSFWTKPINDNNNNSNNNNNIHNHQQTIELVHAPTPEDVAVVAPTAHVAIPFMERFPTSFFEKIEESQNSPSETSPLSRCCIVPKLCLVIQFGVGLEGVDIETATKYGIAVSNMPANDPFGDTSRGTGNAQATSEHALFLTMSLLRHVHDLQRRFQMRELGGLPVPRTLYKKRVTLVGYGSVGKMLCHYLVTMGANVQVVRRRKWSELSKEEEQQEQQSPPPPPSSLPEEEFNQHNDNYNIHNTTTTTATTTNFKMAKSLHEALPTTDILILACLMTPETFHLMNEQTLSLLPRGALVINVGRGPLVEYEAMVQALQSGQVGGFASDVGIGHSTKPSEPWDPYDELSKFHNVLFTPHVGGYTDYAYSEMSNRLVDGIECVMNGKPPPVWVNKSSE